MREKAEFVLHHAVSRSELLGASGFYEVKMKFAPKVTLWRDGLAPKSSAYQAHIVVFVLDQIRDFH